MIQLLKTSGAPTVLKNCLPLARKLIQTGTVEAEEEQYLLGLLSEL